MQLSIFRIRCVKSKLQNGDFQISIPTTNTGIYSHKLCLVGSQNPVGEHAVRQVGKIASPGRKARHRSKHRARACAQARCPLTKIEFQVFIFEILSFQFSSFNFQFSKVRRFKSKFQNGDIQMSIPTTTPHLRLFPQALLCGFSKPCRRACSETGRENRFSGPKSAPGAQAPCPGVCLGAVPTN